ncbi:class I SAM-dependent methyltransferase [Streptomyces sp. NPDC019443]|uniref:class I SAM-dependent methyltransferase n=1 Tax=Streptomyces sp. NPDC019443 TaxID=3365061 RepID=UPI0037983DAD
MAQLRHNRANRREHVDQTCAPGTPSGRPLGRQGVTAVATLAQPRGSQSRVLDVASGRGTTAILLADICGVRVDGVDYSAANTALAQGAAQAAGVAKRAVFVTGDAEQLPYTDSRSDGPTARRRLCRRQPVSCAPAAASASSDSATLRK